LNKLKKLKKELTATNLAEIIESCQKRVIHVNNPPLDIKDHEELALNKEDRESSRRKILDHLKESCQSIYKPKKLQELSNEIATDYFDYLKMKEEFERELELKNF